MRSAVSGGCFLDDDAEAVVVVSLDKESLVGAPHAFSISLLASLAFEVLVDNSDSFTSLPRGLECLLTIGLTVDGANHDALPLFETGSGKVAESCFDGSR